MAIKILLKNIESTPDKTAVINRFKINEAGEKEFTQKVNLDPGQELEVHIFEGCGFEFEALPVPAPQPEEADKAE